MSLVACLLAASVAAAQQAPQAAVVLSHRDKLYDLALHGSTAIAVGYPGLVLAIEGRGERVTKLDVKSREALFAIDLDAKSGMGAIVGRNCTVLTTSDSGRSWQHVGAAVADACQDAALLDVARLPSGRLVAVGELGTIVTSDDHGKTWQRRAFDFALPTAAQQVSSGELSAEEENEGAIEEARLSAVTFAGAQAGFIAGEFGLVLATTDGGTTWKRQNTGTGKLLFDIAVWDASHALAVGAAGAVIETMDGGAIWSTLSVGVEEALFGVAAGTTHGVLVGEHGLLLSRDTAQGAFTRRHTNVYTWLEASRFFDATTGLVVGGRGHLLRTRDGGAHFERLLGQ